MKWIALGAQLALVFTVSLALGLWIGLGPYLAIGLLCALVILALFVARGMDALMRDEELSPAWFVLSLLLAAMLGAFWPLGPLTVGYHRAKLIIVRGGRDEDDEPEAGSP